MLARAAWVVLVCTIAETMVPGLVGGNGYALAGDKVSNAVGKIVSVAEQGTLWVSETATPVTYGSAPEQESRNNERASEPRQNLCVFGDLFLCRYWRAYFYGGLFGAGLVSAFWAWLHILERDPKGRQRKHRG